jgi:glyoxylase-like metal-dependent hydrolase (beta-lactamase superfamily II)
VVEYKAVLARGYKVIVEKLVVGPYASNCYIVGSQSNKEGMIIDPGDEAKRILKKVEELKLDIKLIVLTHGHIDHTGALKEVREATGAEVAVHTDDAQSLGWGVSLISVLMPGLSYPTPPPPDRLLKDGDSIDIGDLHFLVLHTPGHTSGGICLLGEGVVFSGDTLFNYGIGRSDLPGGSHSQLMDSLQTKLMTLPDDTIVYPGHGPETTIRAERRGNPFLRG